jgi:hypothetical protein
MRVAGLPGTEDAIVLLDYSDARRRRRDANLIRVRPDLSIAWRAKPPDPDDTAADEWVHFTISKSGRLTANSGSGYYCRVDVTTGVVERAEFVK